MAIRSPESNKVEDMTAAALLAGTREDALNYLEQLSNPQSIGEYVQAMSLIAELRHFLTGLSSIEETQHLTLIDLKSTEEKVESSPGAQQKNLLLWRLSDNSNRQAAKPENLSFATVFAAAQARKTLSSTDPIIPILS